jgi:6-phosphogluconolactonase
LSQTRELLVLVTGEGKRSAVQAWRDNGDLPVAALRCDAGIDVLLDDKAAGEQS